ncbi:MAG: hypothetical protein KAT65_19420 [Methanophagales archaeon]|nr:hypothetical protein [Methanophagales archaeon]
MNDPWWLPSAIMQTMGALIGIYAVVYVLVAERLGKAALPFQLFSRPKYLLHIHLKAIDVLFFLVFSMGIATIITNSLWLDSLSTQIVLEAASAVEVGELALKLFITTLGVILFYTLYMILCFRRGR